MKISVLIATRHREAWLVQALRSVALQVCDLSNVEIVVVHDGTPGTGIPELDTSTYPFNRPDWRPDIVRYVEQRHAGRSAAINKAYALSGGRYVTVLDDDDLLHPSKLELLSWKLDCVGLADVAFGLPCHVDLFGCRSVETPPLAAEFQRDYPVMTWDLFLECRRWAVHGTAGMYRREVWERAGPWDATLPTCEEWEFNMRCLYRGATFYGLSSVTDYYRIHPGQKSGRKHRQLATRHAVKQRINERIQGWINESEVAW